MMSGFCDTRHEFMLTDCPGNHLEETGQGCMTQLYAILFERYSQLQWPIVEVNRKEGMKERPSGFMVRYQRQLRAQLESRLWSSHGRAEILSFQVSAKLQIVDSCADVPFVLCSYLLVAVGLSMGIPLQGLRNHHHLIVICHSHMRKSCLTCVF